MIPKDAPWPLVRSGVDARRSPWPVETQGASLVATSPPFWSKARYSDADDEWGAGSISGHVADCVAYAQGAWDAVRPGGWLVLNIGDTRTGTGGAGGQISKVNQRVYRPDNKTHGIEGSQWAMIPEQAALAVRSETGWRLTGRVTWKKPSPIRADISAMHLRRNRRPGLQTEMLYFFWKPGGPQVWNADVLVNHQDLAALEAQAYLTRLAESLAKCDKPRRNLLRRHGVLPTTSERRAIERLITPGLKSVLGDVWDLPKHTSQPPWAKPSDDVKAWSNELCERLVLLLTNPGELVADCCAGYGSMIRAAEFHVRRGVAFDLYWGSDPHPV